MFSAFANLNFLPHLAMFVFAVPETGCTLLFDLTLTGGQTLLDIPRFGEFWDKITKPLKFQVKTGFSASWKPMFSVFANLNFLPHLAMFVFAVPETGFTLLFILTLPEGQTLPGIPLC